jgi:hypothetical protein
MKIQNIGNRIHVVIKRELYNSMTVRPKRSDSFLQAFESLNQIVQVIEYSVRKAVKKWCKQYQEKLDVIYEYVHTENAEAIILRVYEMLLFEMGDNK